MGGSHSHILALRLISPFDRHNANILPQTGANVVFSVGIWFSSLNYLYVQRIVVKLLGLLLQQIPQIPFFLNKSAASLLCFEFFKYKSFLGWVGFMILALLSTSIVSPLLFWNFTCFPFGNHFFVYLTLTGTSSFDHIATLLLILKILFLKDKFRRCSKNSSCDTTCVLSFWLFERALSGFFSMCIWMGSKLPVKCHVYILNIHCESEFFGSFNRGARCVGRSAFYYDGEYFVC